jgi:hypothetical protein
MRILPPEDEEYDPPVSNIPSSESGDRIEALHRWAIDLTAWLDPRTSNEAPLPIPPALPKK